MILWGERVGRKGPITSVGSEATCQRIISLINGAPAWSVLQEASPRRQGHSHVYTLPQPWRKKKTKKTSTRVCLLSLSKQESVCLVSLHSVCIKAPQWGTEIPAEAVDAPLPTLLTLCTQVPPTTGLLPRQQYIIQSTAQQTPGLLTLPHFSGSPDVLSASTSECLGLFHTLLYIYIYFFFADFQFCPPALLLPWLLGFRGTCLPPCLSLTALPASPDVSCARCLHSLLLRLRACLDTIPSSHLLPASSLHPGTESLN